ncbi:hydroxymethylglutaryl-CoA lyase [Halobacillus karajensis]|uniref:Hydroxymethylglutaryl-CoA lyase YngG n=1 Tax=Halobacillus karajensis TaxID=195088 RepID=A0A059NV79_9BACI|nr:hydroxymethylglutaryl-CoA lyase [Halobacillus karajensis]CDQ18961.1 Hydroxymethylglutaryl-CoA lyase YngG [Halobacillus karajensis]CDQ22965.1 Hydroxymethylglutaryl-CoA lyase YngG [Halobacillus karajensis]CDQ26448.1 Hydroxymethylglutaryl-CoA lyase YngG [Halobacillus karajensis]
MERIYIQEVVTRDGFQMEDQFVPTERKIALIDRLSHAGVDKVEVTSFVSPKAVPNLRDAEEVMAGIERKPGVTYTALIPNVKGAERAAVCQADEVNLVVSVSETHNLKNVRRTVDESFSNFYDVADVLSGTGIQMNGTLATTFGCPFEGRMDENRVMGLINQYLALGAESITLADTTGMATPKQVYQLCEKVLDHWPGLPVTLHFHNTRGMGLANVMEGIRAGVTRFDASLGGLGGCPFAPGATGNICTEDLVHMLAFMGYDVNVNLDQLIEISKGLGKTLNHELPGQIIKAGKITDLHSTSYS